MIIRSRGNIIRDFFFFFFRQAPYNISRHKFLATIPIPTYTIQNQAILPKCIHKTDDVEVKSLTITDLFMWEIMDGIWLLPPPLVSLLFCVSPFLRKASVLFSPLPSLLNVTLLMGASCLAQEALGGRSTWSAVMSGISSFLPLLGFAVKTICNSYFLVISNSRELRNCFLPVSTLYSAPVAS